MLAKLGCRDILDLALMIPKGYENLTLSTSLQESPAVVLVSILSYRVRSDKLISMQAFMPLFKREIELVIFNPKPYHIYQFSPQKSMIVTGRIETRTGLKMIQPRVIHQNGNIVPILPTLKGISKQKILEFFQSQLSAEHLITHQIPSKYAKAIETIYTPSASFFKEYQAVGFSLPYLRAIKFVEIFRYLLRLHVKKKNYPACPLTPRDPAPFIASLPFSLTQDQLQAIQAIWQDLSGSIASRRVVMGDVGCGKSLIIFAAAFMAYPKRSLLMAPTFLLAQQLYEESQKFLPKEIRVVLVQGGRKSKDFQESLDKAHFIIGTHALLWQDVGEVSLVMIDEQHRFGVSHRNYFLSQEYEENMSQKRTHPHTLQFSATPIPRTLAMIESSFVSFSLIKQRPFERVVETHVTRREDFGTLLAHLKEEVAHGRQVAIVYPSVNESQSLAYRSLYEAESFWRKHFKNVFITHGKDKDKDSTLLDFRDHGEVLLTTTVIEVGISLPRLCVIVIAGAERFGLATLHQLRGRVSRNGLKGYCYLFTHKEDSERLEAFCECKDGFEVAELDLKMRKSGDILGGERQSGEEFKYFDLNEDQKILLEAKEVLGLKDS